MIPLWLLADVDGCGWLEIQRNDEAWHLARDSDPTRRPLVNDDGDAVRRVRFEARELRRMSAITALALHQRHKRSVREVRRGLRGEVVIAFATGVLPT